MIRWKCAPVCYPSIHPFDMQVGSKYTHLLTYCIFISFLADRSKWFHTIVVVVQLRIQYCWLWTHASLHSTKTGKQFQHYFIFTLFVQKRRHTYHSTLHNKICAVLFSWVEEIKRNEKNDENRISKIFLFFIWEFENIFVLVCSCAERDSCVWDMNERCMWSYRIN